MKKQLIAFCLALILTLSMCACSASPAAKQSDSNSSAAEASGDAVKITFLDVMPSADRTALLEDWSDASIKRLDSCSYNGNV